MQAASVHSRYRLVLLRQLILVFTRVAQLRSTNAHIFVTAPLGGSISIAPSLGARTTIFVTVPSTSSSFMDVSFSVPTPSYNLRMPIAVTDLVQFYFCRLLLVLNARPSCRDLQYEFTIAPIFCAKFHSGCKHVKLMVLI